MRVLMKPATGELLAIPRSNNMPTRSRVAAFVHPHETSYWLHPSDNESLKDSESVENTRRTCPNGPRLVASISQLTEHLGFSIQYSLFRNINH